MNPFPYFSIRVFEQFAMLAVIAYHQSFFLSLLTQGNWWLLLNNLQFVLVCIIIITTFLSYVFLPLAWNSAKRFHWANEQTDDIEMLIPKNQGVVS